MSDAHYPEDPTELAALYAAGSLAPDERAAFESHLAAGCATCRDEVERLAPVVAALAAAVRPTLLRPPLERGGRQGERDVPPAG